MPDTAPPAADLQGPAPTLALGPADASAARLLLGGTWRMDRPLPDLAAATALLEGVAGLTHLRLVGETLADWDSGLVVLVAGVVEWCQPRGIDCDLADLPAGLRALLELVQADPDARRVDASTTAAHLETPEPSYVARVGADFVDLLKATGEIIAFFGEVVLATRRFLLARAQFRPSELWLLIQQAGAEALPIVGLVTFLVGMILGYIGDTQLSQFGASIYVANLVGLAMVLQVGALITAIVLAGRTGAAYAAQLGTMQVNEEIDALRTLGIEPMDFLVLPRMIALILMTPLLAIYANLLGILGGVLVGMLVGGVTPTAYLVQTQEAIRWNHISQGLISATVYGAIVAASGCMRGMQCGRSAAAVGEATTSAVVTAIVFIVIAAAILTILFNAVGL